VLGEHTANFTAISFVFCFQTFGMGIWEREDLGLCTVPPATLTSCLDTLLGLFLTNTCYVRPKESQNHRITEC